MYQQRIEFSSFSSINKPKLLFEVVERTRTFTRCCEWLLYARKHHQRVSFEVKYAKLMTGELRQKKIVGKHVFLLSVQAFKKPLLIHKSYDKNKQQLSNN
jgi:hypothetical protein